MVMNETLLLVVSSVIQVGDDVLVSPSLPAEKFQFSGIEKIKIVIAENQILEKDAEISIPLGTRNPYYNLYTILLTNTWKDDVPVGAEIWIKKSLKEIIRKPVE